MLAALSIRDIVLIDKLDLEFGQGLSALTGETGAGKSILLDALALALGARGDASLVRHGKPQGQVTATFELAPDHSVMRLLAENGIDADGGALILRRIQAADGRTRAFINDVAVGVQLIREVGQALVEIHGQHDDRALLDPGGHRDLVDAYGGLGADAAAVASAWEAWRASEAELAGHANEIAAIRANADYVAHALDELKTLDPKSGEEEALAARRQIMMHGEKIAAELAEALDALEREGTGEARLSAALRRIERQSGPAQTVFAPVVEALERVLAETNTARSTVETALAATAFEPHELERVEERLFGIRALARKHKLAPDDLPELALRLEAELAALDQGEGRLKQLAVSVKAAGEAYGAAATRLSQARKDAARRLDAEIAAELAPLKLDKASLLTRIETSDADDGGSHGLDRVAFHVRTNPGTEPGPLMKVASGGELARVILALKVVLAARGSAPTLIFDEADAGVGGATAAAVGERLARLGTGVQVLAVTHAPQVAALANAHLLIAKEAVDGPGGEVMSTRVLILDGNRRREEIARMLAGQTVTDEARAAAERLMSKSA
jgi:DNA repair protein RecN (Recombination protein N)